MNYQVFIRLVSVIILSFTNLAYAESNLSRSTNQIALTNSNLSISYYKQQIEEIGETILHDMAGDDFIAFFGITPTVDIAINSLPEAFFEHPNKVVISHGLLQYISNPSELAFVMAHEIAHHLLGHAKQKIEQTSELQNMISHEIEADQLAIKLLQSGGFNPNAGIVLLTRVSKECISNDVSNEQLFPSLIPRLKAMQRIISALA